VKDYIDRMTAASNDRDRQQITGDQMGTGDINIESVVLGYLGGRLVSRGISDMLEAILGNNDPYNDTYSDPYDDTFRY